MANNGTSGSIDGVVKMLCDPKCKKLSHNQCKPSCIKCWKWDVTQITMNKIVHNIKYGILILNRPITQNQGFLKNLWNRASVRMTVDGGTNQWDKFVSGFSEELQKTIKDPDLISGDFDSISDEVLEKYTKKGCKIIQTPDQNRTDFTKAIMELKLHNKEMGLVLSHVIAVAQNSGRLDQIIGNIQTLFLVKEELLLDPNTNVFIVSDDAISWLLLPGDHVIYVPEETRQHKRAWCSLVPVGESCMFVTTTGLKWNLDNQELRFGRIVSTSNTFDGSEKVTVKCSHTLLWSMRIPMVTILYQCNYIEFTAPENEVICTEFSGSSILIIESEEETPGCHHCYDRPEDTVEPTVQDCPAWAGHRRFFTEAIGGRCLSPSYTRHWSIPTEIFVEVK